MWPRISKALPRSSLVPLLLPEVPESDFEKTSQSLERCLSLIYASWHPKNPTQNIIKDCKILSSKWLFFLLALALGSLRGCPRGENWIASILQVKRNPVQTDILHLSGVVWIINRELRNTKTTDPDSWCTVVLYHPPDHPNCGPNH